MKYITKKWYETKLKTELYVDWIEDERASKFSEELFEELYHNKEGLFINEYTAIPENTKDHTADFIRRRAKRIFRESFFEKASTLQKYLPLRILNKVADIRVLCLDHATDEVIALTKEFCDQNQEIVQKALNDYNAHLVEIFGEEKADYYRKNLDFAGYIISSVRRQQDSTLTIDVEGPESAPVKHRITIIDARLIKKELGILNSAWYFAEIYKIPEGIELHFVSDRNGLHELIVSGADITFQTLED